MNLAVLYWSVPAPHERKMSNVYFLHFKDRRRGGRLYRYLVLLRWLKQEIRHHVVLERIHVEANFRHRTSYLDFGGIYAPTTMLLVFQESSGRNSR